MSVPLNPATTAHPDTDLNQLGSARRGFLKTSFLGGLTLSVAGATAGLTGCGGKVVSAAEGYRYLRNDDVLLFNAIIPVVLAPVSKQEGFSEIIDRVLHQIDEFGFNLEAPAAAEIYKLFDLLNMRVTRWLATGVGSAWQDATAEDIQKFLDKWRDSSIGLFNAGYRALSKFVAVAYFTLPESRAASGYPGPQAWALHATQQNASAGGR